MLFRSLLFSLLTFFPFTLVFSQGETGKLFFIITKDKTEYLGTVEKETDIDVTLRLRTKEAVVVPRNEIKIYEPVTENNFLRGKYAYPSLFGNRYLLASSSIPMGRYQAYFNTYYATTWTIEYGINDIFSAGMTSSVFGVPAMVHAQANYKIGSQLYLGATATGGWLTWVDPGIFFGYGGARLTSGTKNKNYTFGGGLFSLKADLPTFGPSKVSLGDFAYVNFSASQRFTRKVYGMSEIFVLKNILFNRSIYMFNLGSRLCRKQRICWNFFVSTVAFHDLRSNDLIVNVIPCASFSLRVGKKIQEKAD